MKLKDVVCVLALFAVSTAAIRVVFAAGAPCTGWASTCPITPTPVPAGTAECCSPPYSVGPQKYEAAGTGSKNYTQDAAGTQCGNKKSTRMMGGSVVCDTTISYGTCGGVMAQPGCTP